MKLNLFDLDNKVLKDLLTALNAMKHSKHATQRTLLKAKWVRRIEATKSNDRGETLWNMAVRKQKWKANALSQEKVSSN